MVQNNTFNQSSGNVSIQLISLASREKGYEGWELVGAEVSIQLISLASREFQCTFSFKLPASSFHSINFSSE